MCARRFSTSGRFRDFRNSGVFAFVNGSDDSNVSGWLCLGIETYYLATKFRIIRRKKKRSLGKRKKWVTVFSKFRSTAAECAENKCTKYARALYIRTLLTKNRYRFSRRSVIQVFTSLKSRRGGNFSFKKYFPVDSTQRTNSSRARVEVRKFELVTRLGLPLVSRNTLHRSRYKTREQFAGLTRVVQ